MTITAEQMHRALGLLQQATSLRKQFDTYKLAAKTGGQHQEAINVCYKESGSWSDMKGTFIQIPEAARRHVFNLWRRETALKHNAIVRELNQIGMKHGLAVIDLKGL